MSVYARMARKPAVVQEFPQDTEKWECRIFPGGGGYRGGEGGIGGGEWAVMGADWVWRLGGLGVWAGDGSNLDRDGVVWGRDGVVFGWKQGVCGNDGAFCCILGRHIIISLKHANI